LEGKGVSSLLLQERGRGSHGGSLPGLADIVDVLREHGRRLSRIEMALEAMRGGRRLLLDPDDPPCVVCGRWSDDILCPSCRRKFAWMR